MSNMKNPIIKIFVSNRIDSQAVQPTCPLFIPVRCGATYDESEQNAITGDNSGDNISDKRNTFNEFTVLYWAWKNEKADYYGLCHYRRFLSFPEMGDDTELRVERAEEHSNGCVCVDELTDEVQQKMGLGEDRMRAEISKYDAIFIKPLTLSDYNVRSNYEAMVSCPGYHFAKDIDLMMEIIKKKYPYMYETAYQYMHESGHSYLYNCFIMKKELFVSFCEWLFDILFELEKKIDMSNYSTTQRRAIGTLGERLMGIYELWLEKKKYKLHHTPLLFIRDTKPREDLQPAFPGKDSIAIASNFNDNYTGPFSVFLQSIIEHADSSKYYDFIIISEDISDDHQNMLRSMLPANMSIRFVSAKRYLHNLPIAVRDSGYSADLYARLFIPHILSNYDKILAVDADMVCLEDIAHVFETDVSQNTAAAVKDIVFMGYLNGVVEGSLEYAKKYMRMTDPYLYVNTGLLLFNATEYRKMFSVRFLRNFIKKHIKNVRVYEQDMLNMLLYGNIHFIDLKWNMPTVSCIGVKKSLEAAPWRSFREYKKTVTLDQGIFHYADRPKPWVDVTVDRAGLWWKYARKSPFYGEIIQKLIVGRVEHVGNTDCSNLRNEFANIHFPNMNRHFEQIELKINGLEKLIAEGNSNSDCSNLRNEFASIHFPNMNAHFKHIDQRIHSLEELMVRDHRSVIKARYRQNKIKSYICFWNRRRFLRRCEECRAILENDNR